MRAFIRSVFHHCGGWQPVRQENYPFVRGIYQRNCHVTTLEVTAKHPSAQRGRLTAESNLIHVHTLLSGRHRVQYVSSVEYYNGQVERNGEY